MTVALAKRSIDVRGIPPRTTSVTIGLRGGSVVGGGGRIVTTAVIGERSRPTSTSGRVTRLP